jgi:hypothetical protein
MLFKICVVKFSKILSIKLTQEKNNNENNIDYLTYTPEMPIAVENLPLSRRDGFQNVFRISLMRLYWTGNIGTSPSDSFSLSVFHL